MQGNRNMNNNNKKYDELFNQIKMINSLSEQQSSLVKDSVGWNTLEKHLIEEECKLFNDLISLELAEVEYLFKNLQILPMLGIHLYKCMFTVNYTIINDLLTEEAKKFITIMWNYWQMVKEKFK